MIPWPARIRAPPALTMRAEGQEKLVWHGYHVAPQKTWYYRPHMTTVPMDYLRAMFCIEEHRERFVALGALWGWERLGGGVRPKAIAQEMCWSFRLLFESPKRNARAPGALPPARVVQHKPWNRHGREPIRVASPLLPSPSSPHT